MRNNNKGVDQKMGSFTGARLRAYKSEKERLEKLVSKIEGHARYDTDYEPFDLPSYKNSFRLLARTTAVMLVASALLIGASAVMEITRGGPEVWITTQNGLISRLPNNFITQ